MRTITLLTLLLATPLFAADGACPPAWGYENDNGPDRWGQMDMAWAACDAGTKQSPIDIRTSTQAALSVGFNYTAGPLTIQNTSHELKVPTARGTVTLGSRTASLEQFHFHIPSEHHINGVPAAAELHFVNTMANGAIAVAVLIDEGPFNSMLETILSWKPAAECMSRKSPHNFNPGSLLPQPDPGGHRFWTYEGSLTTPECVEGVTFVVMWRRITATRDQLNRLAVKAGYENERGIQPLGTRAVQRNFATP